jgi:allantoin racemase
VVTTRPISVPVLEDNIHKCGLGSRCVGVLASGVGVLEFEQDPQGAAEKLEQVATQTLHNLHPNVLVLGCAGMTGLAPALSERLGIPVVDPIVAATSLAVALARIGILSQSR